MTEPTFDVGILARLRDLIEVDIETRSAGGAAHRATIWVVVDGSDRVLVRSWKGPGARWYREAVAAGSAALALDGTALPVRVERATDPARIAACSEELLAKYAGDPAARSMVREGDPRHDPRATSWLRSCGTLSEPWTTPIRSSR